MGKRKLSGLCTNPNCQSKICPVHGPLVRVACNPEVEQRIVKEVRDLWFGEDGDVDRTRTGDVSGGE